MCYVKYLFLRYNMANNKSIQILRGERAKIASKTDSLLDGQLLYNKTDNYLTVGNGDNAKISDNPVACREVHGYFSDNSGISTNNPSAYNYQIKPEEGNLLISSTGNIELAPTGTLTGKTPAYGTAETPTRDTQLATTEWVHYAEGNTKLNADSATKLKTARKITAGLNTAIGTPFNGESDVTIAVSGVLGQVNGGTGKTSTSQIMSGGSFAIQSLSVANDNVGSIPLLKAASDVDGAKSIYQLTQNSNFKLTKNESGEIELKVPAVVATDSIQATSFNATSDRRKKENIKQAYFDATDFVNHLRVVNFNYIGNEEKNIGLIAQEVDELDCGVALTATGSDGFEVLKETKLIYVLIKALQEANERIDELEKQIKKEG